MTAAEISHLEAAFNCYGSAAEQGFVKGMVLVAMFYEHGLYVAQSLEKAVKWYRRAIETGTPEAVEKATKLLAEAQATQKGIKKKPCERSHSFFLSTSSTCR